MYDPTPLPRAGWDIPDISLETNGFRISHVCANTDQAFEGCHPSIEGAQHMVRLSHRDVPGNVWNVNFPEGYYWLGLIDEPRGFTHMAFEREARWQADGDNLFYEAAPVFDWDDRKTLEASFYMTSEDTDTVRYTARIRNVTDRPMTDCVFNVCCNHTQVPMFGDNRFMVSDGKPVSIKEVWPQGGFARFRVCGARVHEQELLLERFCHREIEADGKYVFITSDELTVIHGNPHNIQMCSNSKYLCLDQLLYVGELAPGEEKEVGGMIHLVRGKKTPQEIVDYVGTRFPELVV